MTDDKAIVDPLPVDPDDGAKASGQPVNAREYFAGVILGALMSQNRNMTADEAMATAWQYADEMQFIGVWGPPGGKDE